MNVEYARPSSDAIARTKHPRLDYRTAEAKRYTSRLRPYLQQYLSAGCRALDLGCGAGKFTFEMEHLGARATGLDCSEGAIRLARELAVAMGSSAEFHVGTYEQLPFPEQSFDLVLFPMNIIECAYGEFDAIARQVAIILRHGGVFCVEMRDGLAYLRDGRARQEFDLLSGCHLSSIDTPEGSFPYETTFWTVGFARFVGSRYLRFSRVDSLPSDRHVLVFQKTDANVDSMNREPTNE